MSPGRPDTRVVDRHLIALRKALAIVRRHAGALPRTFGVRFRGIAGLRNVLVHGYLDIDLDLLAGILSERLDDFENSQPTSSDGWPGRRMPEPVADRADSTENTVR